MDTLRSDVEKQMRGRNERRKRKWEEVGEEHEETEDNKCLVIKAEQKSASRAEAKLMKQKCRSSVLTEPFGNSDC